jgi:hypothetical protein
MVRLHAVVEGPTEETCIRLVLTPVLAIQRVFIDAHSVITGRNKKRADEVFKGGIQRYEQLRFDLTSWMKQDRQPDARFTTMIDLYRLPRDFPGFADCRHPEPIERVACLEEQLARDVKDPRFLPYLQLHEFEALLFSDVSKFESRFPDDQSLILELLAIRRSFATPEHIDDHPDLAPSKRISSLRRDYKKPVDGPTIAANIGLAILRRECPHFDQWVAKMEAFITPPGPQRRGPGL